MTVIVNLPISANEVPTLRESVGWDRRDLDYPSLFARCNFWAGARDEKGLLIAFGYIAGTGLQHGYLEDIIVHPNYSNKGIGTKLVKVLLLEAQRRNLEIVTVTYDVKHTKFYKRCGFTPCSGGIWRK